MIPHHARALALLVLAGCEVGGESFQSGGVALVDPCPTGDGLTVLPAEIDTPVVAPGGSLSYALRFEGAVPLPRAYRVFVHFLDPSTGQHVFQDDFDPSPGTL